MYLYYDFCRSFTTKVLICFCISLISCILAGLYGEVRRVYVVFHGYDASFLETLFGYSGTGDL